MNGFGWIESPEDPRDYPLSLALDAEPVALPVSKTWSTARVPLDQRDTNACTGFSLAGWSICLPVNGKMTPNDAWALWRRAIQLDGRDPAEWKGGATLRSACKAMRLRGRVASYYFTKDAEEARRFVLTRGPIVIGSLWWPNMTTPHNGIMTADGGAVQGGHAYLIRGSVGKLARIRNSWGTRWPDAYMRWDTVQTLLNLGGECWAAVERSP